MGRNLSSGIGLRALQLGGLVLPDVVHFAVVDGREGHAHFHQVVRVGRWSRIIPVNYQGSDSELFIIENLLLENRGGIGVITALHAHSLVAQGVLVNFDKILILQNRQRFFGYLGQVASDNQGSLGKCPESEVSLLLVESQQSISDLEHIRIIPVSGASRLRLHLIFDKIGLETLPLIVLGGVDLNILGSPPHIGNRVTPLGDVLIAPIAD